MCRFLAARVLFFWVIAEVIAVSYPGVNLVQASHKCPMRQQSIVQVPAKFVDVTAKL